MRKNITSQTAPRRQRKYGWRHLLRERSWAALSLVVAVTTILNVSSISALVVPMNASALTGAIWTTSNACGTEQQDVNHYKKGQHVYINGKNFSSNTSYAWEIKGKPGNASNDPGIVVASGNKTTTGNGSFCFDAYTVPFDDGGEYQVKFETKGDNYQVDEGSLKVSKKLDANGDGSFETSNPASFTWGLDNGPVNRVMGSGGEIDLAVGSYIVKENSVNGFHLVGWYKGSGSCSDLDGTSTTVTFDIDKNEDQTVTFCNALDRAPEGTIKVNKKVDTNGDGTFEGGNTTANNLGFRWGFDNGAVTRSMGTEVDVPTGNHTVTENTIDGYHLVGWYVDGRGSCAEPQGTTLPVSVNIDNDDTDTVTFCNAKDKEEEKPVTIQAWKIVCAVEADLPNWGSVGGPNITATTAQDWVNAHESCSFASDWSFQWAPDYPGNPGDNTGAAGAPWTTFGPTDGTGFTSATINDLDGMKKLWVREVWKNGYIPFTYGDNDDNSNAVSAEMYCNTDVINYDNFDWIDGLKQGDTFNCVAWNVQENGSVTVTKKLDNDGDGQFESTNPQGWSWQLDETTGLMMGDTAVATSGEHMVVEHGPSDGYHFVGWFPTGQDYSCENLPENELNWIHPITVTVNAGQNTAITICNQKDAPKTGTIIVHKEVDVNGNGVFTDNVDGTDAKGNALGFRWGVTQNATNEVFGDSLVVPAGDVSVWENTVANYSLVGWHYTNDDVVCTPRVIRGDTKSELTPQGNVTNEIMVSVGEGQTVEITLCNQRDTGTVSGYKWHDLNGNGEWDKGEPTLEGWYFQTLHGQGDTTDESGYYEIPNVPTGQDWLVEFVKDGWINTNYNNAAEINVVKNETTSVNFGNFHVGSITGSKFSDENHNGTWNEGESGLANWTIELWKFDQYYFDHTEEYGVNDGYLKETETVTDDEGDYTFANLGPGSYRVREVQKDGWMQTTTNPADIAPLMSGQNVTNVDFGNYGVPNLTVTKIVDKATANPGDTLNYTITVTNSGQGDAFGVRVDDTLPTAFVGAATSIVPVPTSTAAGHLVWENVTIPANGGTFVATFSLAVNALMPAGTTVITNTVDLGNTVFQDDSAVSHQSVVTPIISNPVYTGHATAVTTVTATPTITLDKQGPASATPGQQFTYTLGWAVSGNASVTNAIVTDPIPANTTFVTADNAATFLNGVVTWNLGAKVPGNSGTLSVTVIVNPNLVSSTTLSNTGTFDTDQTQPVTDTVQTSVLVPQVLGISAEADLNITKSVDSATATPGDTLTYTLVITNSGEADATNVVVTDNLPDGFVFLAGGRTTRTWNIGTLAAGASKTLTYKVVVKDNVIAGQHINRAFVTADFFDPIVAEAIVTVKVPQVLGLADTGAGLQDLLTFVLGFILLAAGGLGFRKLRFGRTTA